MRSVVLVRWVDSVIFDPAWDALDDVVEAAGKGYEHHETVGFLVHSDSERLVLAGSISRNFEKTRVASPILIPRACVLSTEDLRLPEPRP